MAGLSCVACVLVVWCNATVCVSVVGRIAVGGFASVFGCAQGMGLVELFGLFGLGLVLAFGVELVGFFSSCVLVVSFCS